MKVVRFASGLGNVMFQYALYLQVCKQYPDEKVYIDTIFYEFTGRPFELSRIFNIDFNNNFYDYFTKEYDIDLASKLEELRFWKKYGFDYSSFCFAYPIVQGLLHLDELPALYSEKYPNMKIISQLPLSIRKMEECFQEENEECLQECLQEGNKEISIRRKVLNRFKSLLDEKHGALLQFLCAIYSKNGRRRLVHQLFDFQKPDFCRFQDLTRIRVEGDAYYNLYGNPMDCDGIREQLLQAFSFPDLDEKNKKIKQEIVHSNSVGIHARIIEFEYGMGTILNRGYYIKAVNYIKKQSNEKMRYFIFSDNVDWCKENLRCLGLQERDDITWVEGNTGENAYKDMQLMTYCKYHIIPNSTFSWWGGYLSQREGKMMITPYGTLPGTVSF